MNDIATNTSMYANRELFRDSPTALRTRLGRRGEGLIPDEPSTSTLSLVGQHIKEHSPPRICDVFSEMMIMKHSINVEGLDPNETISVYDGSALLMQEVHSLISDFNIAHGNFMACFPPVGRALLFPAQSSLELFEFMLGFDKKAWIRNCFPVAQGGEILYADIYSDFSVGVWMRPFTGFNLTRKDSEPLSCSISLNGHGLEFSFRNSVQNDGYVTYLGNMKSFVGEKLEARLGVCDRLNTFLKAGKSHLNPRSFLLFLDSAKEVFVGFGKSVTTILKNLRVNLCKLRSGVFNLLKNFIKFRSYCQGVTLRICLSAFLKKRVIHLTAQIKLRK